jgi:23S rRNA (adenine-N6)-dimethyltransferase
VAARRGRTPRDARRRAYAQNFLASRALASQLVRDARVERSDLVVEVGAGRGVLTAELARRAKKVQAIELDPAWAQRLREGFAENQRVEVIEADVLRVQLPTKPFRLVASLPFNITTRLLRRVLNDPEIPLVRADLIVQWEVARKRAGRPRTALSASWSPWWRFRIGRKIPRTAFRPRPAVDAGVLVVERRPDPLLPTDVSEAFASFVQSLFAGTLVRELDPTQWAALFAAYARETNPGTDSAATSRAPRRHQHDRA